MGHRGNLVARTEENLGAVLSDVVKPTKELRRPCAVVEQSWLVKVGIPVVSFKHLFIWHQRLIRIHWWALGDEYLVSEIWLNRSDSITMRQSHVHICHGDYTQCECGLASRDLSVHILRPRGRLGRSFENGDILEVGHNYHLDIGVMFDCLSNGK